MPLWNKRAVSSGQTEETYKEQLQSLKQTVNNLGLVSEQFEGAAEGLTESSDKVRHGVQVLAEGASRQERDVLQCRKIAEEFTAKITDMDQETATMQTQVQQMQQQSDLGRQRVEHLGKTQEKLKGSMDTITEEIRTLLDKNAKIESVTSVLYSIAKQTNLLSLNASIEAARAGEAGKGFAVVANEIRELSSGTQASSNSIMEALSRLEAISEKMMKSISETVELIQVNIEKVSNVNQSVTNITNDATSLGENIKVVDSAVKEVETSNQTLTDNMHQVGEVMEVMTQSISGAELTTKTMLSKYEASAKSALDIESVVGKLMEELGVGGFMGVQDVKPGMKITIALNDDSSKKEYAGEVVDCSGKDLFVTAENGVKDFVDKKNKHELCKLHIVVDNVLYYWDDIEIHPVRQGEKGQYKLHIESNPKVYNRRKYPRMPISNACTIRLEGTDKTIFRKIGKYQCNGLVIFLCVITFLSSQKGKKCPAGCERFCQ